MEKEGAHQLRAPGAASESSSRGQVAHRVRRGVVSALLLTCFGSASARIGGHLAFAQETWQGFAVTGVAGPSGQIVPGGKVEIRFRASNGDTVTDTPFVATATPPEGTTLVAHTQRCGVEGGSCSESWIRSKLQWEIPAGTAPGLSFTFSFTVSLPAALPTSPIVPRLTFNGPGCQMQPSCTFDAPLVAVVEQSDGAGGPMATASTTDPPTPPQTDNQNLEVVVPSCKAVGSRPNDKTRLKCTGSTGAGSPPPGKGKQSSGSGLAFTTKPPGRPSALAYTGANLLLSTEAALLCLGAGLLLVLVSRYPRRRPQDLGRNLDPS